MMSSSLRQAIRWQPQALSLTQPVQTAAHQQKEKRTRWTLLSIAAGIFSDIVIIRTTRLYLTRKKQNIGRPLTSTSAALSMQFFISYTHVFSPKHCVTLV